MIYVDDAAIKYKGRKRYHMTADRIDELHSFADDIGVARCWFHRTPHTLHYDIREDQRKAAIERGARLISVRDMVVMARRLKNAQA